MSMSISISISISTHLGVERVTVGRYNSLVESVAGLTVGTYLRFSLLLPVKVEGASESAPGQVPLLHYTERGGGSGGS